MTQLDTGLDGHTYFDRPGDDWRRATCVWYSDTGRTLTITIAIEQDQVFCSLWQFVIGDLILFYCDGDGQGAAGVRVPHTGSAPPIVSRDDQVGVPV